MPRKWTRRLLFFLLIAGIAFVLDTRSVSAHAFLLGTEPADGLVLADAPKQMRFWFSEPLEVDLTTITIQDGDNHSWQLQPYADATNPSVLVVDLPELPPGAYRVAWRTVSDEDLHVISGSIVFGIQQSVSRGQTSRAQSSTPMSEVASHWIGLLAFAAIIGTLVNILFLLPRVKTKMETGHPESINLLPALQNKMVLIALCCSVIAFIAGMFMLWEKYMSVRVGASVARIFDWESLTSFANIIYIQRGLASEVCLLFMAFLFLHWYRREADRKLVANIRNILLCSLAALWIIIQALNSHASAFNDFSPTRVIAYAFHILGAGLWIGGQVALILLVAPRLRQTHNEHYTLGREIYVQFGYVAAIGVAILIVTGIYSGGQQVASLDALLVTDYGRALIFKTVIVILTCLIGLWHSSLFHPKVARPLYRFIQQPIMRMSFGKANPPATLRLQLLGGIGIFLLAAFLGSTPPARGPEFEAPARALPVESAQPDSLSQMADDLLINFSIKPNQPGQNFITVGVYNTRRPSPAEIEDVIVKLSPPDGQGEVNLEAALSEQEGTYQVSTSAIDLSGDWNASVIVKRNGLEDAVLEIPWSVLASTPVSASRPILISNQPLAPWLTFSAVVLIAVLGILWLVSSMQPRLTIRLKDKSNNQP